MRERTRARRRDPLIEQQLPRPTDYTQRFSYPRTINNRAGERSTFVRRLPSARGERLEVENVVAPGAVPPMHIHYYQEGQQRFLDVASRLAAERRLSRTAFRAVRLE